MMRGSLMLERADREIYGEGVEDNLQSQSDDVRQRQVNAPSSWDWRNQGAVSSVQNQICDSCWTFSTMAALESQMMMAGQKEILLSEEQLLDCVVPDRHVGDFCGGWDPQVAIQYLRIKGAMSAASYPYSANDTSSPYYNKTGVCNYDPSQVVQAVSGLCSLKVPVTPSDLKNALYNNGPHIIQVTANKDWGAPFEADKKFQVISCNSFDSEAKQGNHAILLVGYGTDDWGTEYWIVKNSWGTGWGDNGFGRVSMAPGTDCGLSQAIIAVPMIPNSAVANYIGCRYPPPTFYDDPWNYCVNSDGSFYSCPCDKTRCWKQ